MSAEFHISGIIKLYGRPLSLYYGLSPENTTSPANMKIKCMPATNSLCCIISGDMSIGRIKNTIDDILKTATLITNINTEMDG